MIYPKAEAVAFNQHMCNFTTFVLGMSKIRHQKWIGRQSLGVIQNLPLLWRGNEVKNCTAVSEKTERYRILLPADARLQLLNRGELARLHLTNFLRRCALPSRGLALQTKQVQLKLLSFTLREARDFLLQLQNAHWPQTGLRFCSVKRLFLPPDAQDEPRPLEAVGSIVRRGFFFFMATSPRLVGSLPTRALPNRAR